MRNHRYGKNWRESAEYVLLWMFLINVAQLQMSKYRDPKNKHGVFGGDKIKTTKYKKYNGTNAENDSRAPWQMNRKHIAL